jgi:Fe-Mn family superoxide dismutase
MNKPTMNKIEEKIQQLETQIVEQKVSREKTLLITEMKKIGIEKLPYSYSALKQFIDSETMDIHYNKHYKGYVDKLNDALSKKKYGDVELEQIIKTISRFDKIIRNNAGGAFNHALFWKMLSPEPTKLKGDLQKKIIKEFGSFPKFKKEFETVAKDRFGSGWVWLVLTSRNTLKIMSTPNQDNPLMNIIDGGGFPILGLDVWEHAYYLKYQNKRDEYISNFWQVVNWNFVTKLYEMKSKSKLSESSELKKIMKDYLPGQFCDSSEISDYKELINNREIKVLYQNGITEALREVFEEFWVESKGNEMSGFYGVESEGARSVLNNLNTNFNAFCLLTKAVNRQIELINKPDKVFNFSKEENRNIKEVQRLINALKYFKNEIFSIDNQDFINIIRVLLSLWDRGQKSEDEASKIIKNYFGDRVFVSKTGGAGKKVDAFGGVDLILRLGENKYFTQVKAFSNIKKEDGKITVFDTGDVKLYKVDWMIFINYKTKKVLIFKNNPIEYSGQYVFDESSLLYEIN